MRVTLFLGAGFSAPFGHPVMDRFFDVVASNPRLSPQDQDLLATLILEARRANSFLESSPKNLEDILSLAMMGERLGMDAGGRSDHLKKIIQKAYTKLRAPKNYWDLHNEYSLEQLLGFDLNSLAGNLSIVTTNYDLNIECSCYIRGQQMDPGFEIKRLPLPKGVHAISSYYRTNAIPLLKLHGSVNWFLSEGGPLVDDSMVPVISRSFAGRSDSQLPYP